jgi:hypothetical protein
MKPLAGLLLITLLLCTIAPESAIAQNHYFTVKSLKYEAFARELHFPVFYSDSARALPTAKINQLLQLSELEMLKGYQTKTIFECVNYDNGTIYGGKTEMTYEVYTNNSKVLSLGFNEASSGMTTASWLRYYNFNPGNGDLMQLPDLFTAAGFKQFKSQAIKKSISAFKDQIHAAGEQDSVWQGVISDLHDYITDDFYIKGNSIILDGENRLSKNQKGWDMVIQFNLPSFSKYLSDYGKCVFGLKSGPVAQYKSKSLHQLFTGKIDKSAILFVLWPEGKTCEGIYCYQKYGRGITVRGDFVNGQIDVEEESDGLKTKPHITGKVTADSIIAMWTKTKTSGPLPFVVYRK